MGSACSLEILRCISVRKATKLYVDIAFLPHSFQYRKMHQTIGLLMQASRTLLKTGTYLPNILKCVTKHNSKLTWIFMFYSTRNFINYSEYKSDFFLRNIVSKIHENSYDPGNHSKNVNIPSFRSVLFGNLIKQCGSFRPQVQLLFNFRSLFSLLIQWYVYVGGLEIW